MVDSIYIPSGTQTTSSSVCLQHTVTRAVLNVNKIRNIDPKRDYFVSISAGTGTTQLIAPQSGFNILVNNYTITSQSGTTVYFLSGTGKITGDIYMSANDHVESNTVALKTKMSEGLSINNTNGNIGGSITYRIV